MYEEDIERIFLSDIREKRITASGLRGRASRLHKHENIVMPIERMQKQQRKVITAPGIIHLTTEREIRMDELSKRIGQGEIIPKNEIDALPFKDGQKIIAELRRLYSTNDLFKFWKISRAQCVYYMENKYEVYKNRSTGQVTIGKVVREEEKLHKKEMNDQTEEAESTYKLRKELSGEQLGDLFIRLQMFYGESELKYEIELLIKEIK